MIHLSTRKNIMIVIVSHFTYGWIQDCVNSIRVYCPEFPLLIVDNNPSKDDNENRSKSYAKRVWLKENYSQRCEMCELEREWIHKQDNITILKTSTYMSHGGAIDKANLWAHENNVDILVCMDPDCIVFGRKWIDFLTTAIKNGYWLACGSIRQSGVTCAIPGAYNVTKSIDYSFCDIKNENYEDDLYKKIVKRNAILNWKKKSKKWDFGEKFFYECAKLGKVAYIPTFDFTHFAQGSRGNYHSLQKQYMLHSNCKLM